MRRLINSEVIWSFLSGINMFPIDNVRSLTQGVLWPFCHTISASLGVQQCLHFIVLLVKEVEPILSIRHVFSLLALLVDVADSLENSWRNWKSAMIHQVDLGQLALSCIHIYMQHVYLKMDWVAGCAHTNIPPETNYAVNMHVYIWISVFDFLALLEFIL